MYVEGSPKFVDTVFLFLYKTGSPLVSGDLGHAKFSPFAGQRQYHRPQLF